MSNAIGQVASALEEAETPLSDVADRLPKTVSKKKLPKRQQTRTRDELRVTDESLLPSS